MRILMTIGGAGIGDIITFTGCARSLVEDHSTEVWVNCRMKGHDYCARNPFIAGWSSPRPAGDFDHEIDMMCAVIGGEDQVDERKHGVLVRSRVEMAAAVWTHELARPVRPTLPVYQVTDQDARWAREWFERERIDPDRAIAFQPVAKNVWRTWPRPLARRFVNLVREASLTPLVFHHRLDEIESLGGRRVIADRFWKAAAILAQARFFVGVDSGLFHLAAALGVGALGLFGATTGKAIAGVYPKATFIQGEAPARCRAPCHKQRARGFTREKCWHVGCEAMWGIDPEAAWQDVVKGILR